MPKFSDAFGERIAEMLDERDLSPYAVERMATEQLGETLSHQTVRNAMKGKVPSPEVVIRLALTLGVHPNELLDLTDWRLRYVGDPPARVIEALDDCLRPVAVQG